MGSQKISFTSKKEALDFFVNCLSKGIYSRYDGISIAESGTIYHYVEVNVDKTIKLKYERY